MWRDDKGVGEQEPDGRERVVTRWKEPQSRGDFHLRNENGWFESEE